MDIRIKKNGKEIRDANKWFELAPPKGGELQWKNGRSAKELARFATDPSFVEFIKMVLANEGIEEQDFVCEPEAETYFGRKDDESIDLGTHGPRNHDLLMFGKTCVIGLEAKVSEHFGENTVKGEWDSATSTEKKDKRISGLIKFVSNGRYEDYASAPDHIKAMQYQLFTATAGTVLEAKRAKKQKNSINEALFLVLVFTGNVSKDSDYEQKVIDNDCAFKEFSEEFFGNGVSEIQGVKCRIIEQKVRLLSNYRFGED